jgi:Yip1 domain
MNIVARTHGILTNPPAEWSRIGGEPGDVIQLLISYVVPLALIPALSGFVGACLVGVVVPGVGTVRAPVLQGFLGATFGYVTACAIVLFLGLVIDLLAPVFNSRRDFERAFKLAVYSYTPFWLAGVFLLAPGLRFLIVLSVYGAYLLWKGLPRLMGTPTSKVTAFAAVVVGCAAALTLIVAAVQHAMFGLAVL